MPFRAIICIPFFIKKAFISVFSTFLLILHLLILTNANESVSFVD